ncbi:hypothetical protein EMPS_00041 [Entomortierella parvispora]|uniref:Major facilitator superfamily domain-containing protein n=1 Tax=Entomortierella parvispora TaxID=205924 RepID=A0A9P3GYY4_9FUNG|nr:hypothetical protein EMPS_00041 [Entomortierella parvispora]
MARLTDPVIQVAILGAVFFCLPAFFNALNGLGSFGLTAADAHISNNAGTALGVLFAFSSLVAGGLFNLFGHRYLLFFGGLSYALYMSSYLAYHYIQSVAFIVVAACVLGVGAGCLWCAQGAIMMGYPTEGEKGKYFGVFWGIFNAGAVVGNIIQLAMQWNDKASGEVAPATQIVFIAVAVIGSFLSLLLLPASRITRSDGTPAASVKFSSPTTEVKAIFSLFKDWRMLALFPMFFTSNWFYTYHFSMNALNSPNSVRTRAFDSMFYWGAQIFASVAFGNFLDNTRWTRRTRGRYGFLVLICFLTAAWAGGIAYQSGIGIGRFHDYDFVNTTGEWIKFFFLYFVYGICDAMFQAYAYWLMGSLSNDMHVVARFSGFYKFAQNVGNLLAPQVANSPIGNTVVPASRAIGHGMGEILICVALVALSIICAAPVVFKAIQDSTTEEDAVEEKHEIEYENETKA